MNKAEIRRLLLKERSEMSKADVEHKSERIFKNIIKSNILNFNNILLYADFKNEVKTGCLINYLLENKKAVYLPVCAKKGNRFGAAPIYEADFDSDTNRYGIAEPKTQEADLSLIDCAVVPGIAFDEKGNRIGFGSGYYDRFFCKNKTAYKIALCYEFQLTKGINPEKTDMPVDMIITEGRTLICTH